MLGCSRLTVRTLSTTAAGGLVDITKVAAFNPGILSDARRWMSMSAPDGSQPPPPQPRRWISSSDTPKPPSSQPKVTLTKRRRPYPKKSEDLEKLIGEPLQIPAGPLYGGNIVDDEGDTEIIVGDGTKVKPAKSTFFIPQHALHEEDGREKKRVLVLCTGGTLTMAPDPSRGGALAPVEGALISYMKGMLELHDPLMPEVVVHEYIPFHDSSDLGPADWAVVGTCRR